MTLSFDHGLIIDGRNLQELLFLLMTTNNLSSY